MGRKVRCGQCEMPNLITNKQCWNCNVPLRVKCDICGELFSPQIEKCQQCNTPMSEFEGVTNFQIEQSDILKPVEKKYAALRTMAAFYKVFAVIIVIVSVIGIVFAMAEQGKSAGMMVGPILLGLVSFPILLAISEGIIVFLAIEENTRTIASILKQQKG